MRGNEARKFAKRVRNRREFPVSPIHQREPPFCCQSGSSRPFDFASREMVNTQERRGTRGERVSGREREGGGYGDTNDKHRNTVFELWQNARWKKKKRTLSELYKCRFTRRRHHKSPRRTNWHWQPRSTRARTHSTFPHSAPACSLAIDTCLLSPPPLPLPLRARQISIPGVYRRGETSSARGLLFPSWQQRLPRDPESRFHSDFDVCIHALRA